MKLYITAPSPFARKCRIVAREKGLIDRIEEIAVDPYANAPELLASNPVVQVPTLIAEDGLTDALFSFTEPETGAYFWCPPVHQGRIDLRLGTRIGP